MASLIRATVRGLRSGEVTLLLQQQAEVERAAGFVALSGVTDDLLRDRQLLMLVVVVVRTDRSATLVPVAVVVV